MAREQELISAYAPTPMQWLYEQWHAFAAWAAAQPVYVQLPIGVAILVVAYLIFAVVISRLLPRPQVPRETPEPGRMIGSPPTATR